MFVRLGRAYPGVRSAAAACAETASCRRHSDKQKKQLEKTQWSVLIHLLLTMALTVETADTRRKWW